MALTLTQLQTMVQSAIGSRTDVTLANITTYLNLMQTRIARQHTWNELRQGPTDIALSYTGTAATDKTQDISGSLTSLRSIVRLVLEDSGQSHVMRYLTPRQFDEQIPLPEWYSTGRPEVYTIWGNNILIHPVLDQSYTLRATWLKWPTDMSASGDTPTLTYKDDMLFFLTCSFIFALLREENQANRFWSYYQNELKSALKGAETDAPDLGVVLPNFSLVYTGRPAPASDPFNFAINTVP